MTTNLHDRQRQLLSTLNASHGYMTGAELAAALSVSERTVRYDMDELRRVLKPGTAEIVSARGKGYALLIHNRAEFHQYLATNSSLLSRDDRVRYLLTRLCWADEPLEMEALEDEMYISRATLDSDCRVLQRTIAPTALHRQGNRLRIRQDEARLRQLLLRHYIAAVDYDSREGILCEFTSRAQMDEISDCLRSVFQRNNLLLDDVGFMCSVLSIALACTRYDRVDAAHPLPVSPGASAGLVRQLLDSCPCAAHLRSSLWEQAWLESIFDQLLLLARRRDSLHWLPYTVSDEDQQFLDTLLRETGSAFHIPFLTIDMIRDGLARYLNICRSEMAYVLLCTQKPQQYGSSDCLSHAAQFLAERLRRYCRIEDELAPLTEQLRLLLELAQNRYLLRHPEAQVTATFGCHLPSLLSDCMLQQLERQFGGRIRWTGPISIYDKDALDRTQTDFIVSTAYMDEFRRFDRSVVTVSARLDSEDLDQINRQALRALEARLYR